MLVTESHHPDSGRRLARHQCPIKLDASHVSPVQWVEEKICQLSAEHLLVKVPGVHRHPFVLDERLERRQE